MKIAPGTVDDDEMQPDQVGISAGRVSLVITMRNPPNRGPQT